MHLRWRGLCYKMMTQFYRVITCDDGCVVDSSESALEGIGMIGRRVCVRLGALEGEATKEWLEA